MISKINKIKKLGLVFSNYTWNSHVSSGQLPKFKRFNLIYGWTGSGKTTLSRLFDSVEKGDNPDNPNLEYEIEDGENNKFTNGQPFNKKVRVFNQDYVENNIEIKKGRAKSITLVLGEVNKKIVKQIEDDQKEVESKKASLTEASDKIETYNKTKNKTFTEIAKTIYVAITGGAIRNYRSNDAKKEFDELTSKGLLSDEDLTNFSLAVKQKSQPKVDDSQKITVTTKSGEEKDLSDIIKNLLEEGRQILSKTVESETIKRLKDNPDISSWVEKGIKIHSNHKSTKCEFCNQDLPKNRLSDLGKHFNEADKTLKEDIDRLLSKFSYLKSVINEIACPDKARLYDEMQNSYGEACKKFNIGKDNVIASIEQVVLVLEKKKAKTTESVTLNQKIKTDEFSEALKDVKRYIDLHNKKTDDFDNEKSKVVAKLKKHYLSTIFDEIKNIDSNIELENNKIKILKNGDPKNPNEIGTEKLVERITKNQEKISSTLKACGDMNKNLAIFLGRDELKFEPHKTKTIDGEGNEVEIEDGYILKRNGGPANNLSDGEKTAIAFIYFIIHLQDNQFELDNGVVVIDDPVSSLDSNSQFQAFAFLKNAVKDAHQIFVLTHNFSFLKLLINWVKNIERGKHSEYYMIKNYVEDGKRLAYIDKMDEELYKYETEYQYLFKILKKFDSSSDDTIAEAYPIPNIARKLLDTFLMFRVPSSDNIYDKLEIIKKTTKFDSKKLTAIYNFTNDLSHITGSGFNPSLVPESRKNVKCLLEMIKEIFPEHYKILEESITSL